MPIVAEAQLSRGLLHLAFTPIEFFVSDGDQLFRRIRNHLRSEFDHQRVAANRVADYIAGIPCPGVDSPAASTGGAAKVSSSNPSTGAPLSASGPAGATWAAGPRHCRSGVARTQADHFFSQIGRVIAERLIRRLVWFIHPPGEERVVAVVIPEPYAKRASQAVDCARRSIGY